MSELEAARVVLRRTFGHADFRGLQSAVIAEVLAGRSALAVLPTGGGKSLCYQIPAIVRPGLGLVISPLIALMSDQVAALQQSGVAGETWRGAIRARVHQDEGQGTPNELSAKKAWQVADCWIVARQNQASDRRVSSSFTIARVSRSQ